MTDEYRRIALVTGANQGVGFEVAKKLVANGVTVLLGSRNFERGRQAAEAIGTSVHRGARKDNSPKQCVSR